MLKKVGEEAREIGMEAKNAKPEEGKDERSDGRYDAMVRRVESGVTWEDSTGELEDR